MGDYGRSPETGEKLDAKPYEGAGASYSYKDTAAYAHAHPEQPEQEGYPLKSEHELFELPSARYARDHPTEPTAVEGRLSNSSGQMAPITLAMNELFSFFGYVDILYGRDEIPEATIVVEMSERARDDFKAYQRSCSDGDGIAQGGRRSFSNAPTMVPMSSSELNSFWFYWKRDARKEPGHFEPIVRIYIPVEEREKFAQYEAFQRDPVAFAARPYSPDALDLKPHNGCMSGCKAVAITLAIGIALFVAVIFIAVLLFGGELDDVEQGGMRTSAELAALEERRIEMTQQAGDIAYVVQMEDAAAEGGVRAYVFAPVEIARESDDLVFTAAVLWSEAGDGSSSRYCLNGDNTIIDELEKRGYAALQEAVWQAVFGFTPGTYWALYAFEVDSAGYWEPQVEFQMLDDEGAAAKSFIYHAEQVSFEEMEAISQERMSQEGNGYERI